MDTLKSASEVVSIKSLSRWSEMDIPKYSPSDQFKESPFPCRPDLNQKLRISEENGVYLETMALVHPTSENLREPNKFTDQVYEVAGPDLLKEVKNEILHCRTGDAVLTKGYHLRARYLIHTVGPRFNIKYKTAAESALYNCYRQTLLLAKENHISSIALGAIHTARRGYPPEEGAHIAIRTIRRILEKHADAFDTIVLTISGIDESVYPDILRLYFPRSEEEEQWAVDLLPDDIGNADGEPFIPERKIRITGDPTNRDEDGDFPFSRGIGESPDEDEINARGHALPLLRKIPTQSKQI
ncbi:hypothetical protein BSL78_06091 [Apostichopus japonicus]|uniref:Macro domain-containing protein n=1 Tax=Stichopus japonicus TaxID=307972 RepID=A0A2G8LA28_STIJA|nr:hypothetical protein BSL78_06091 [Apostichopus japonicus]